MKTKLVIAAVKYWNGSIKGIITVESEDLNHLIISKAMRKLIYDKNIKNVEEYSYKILAKNRLLKNKKKIDSNFLKIQKLNKKGYNTQEIAYRLGIEINEVKNYLLSNSYVNSENILVIK
ncbi:hypothetical protein FHS04_002821 [Mesoflavibacter sabulilitoris]|uniref:Uncharacterized protein n=1 Tax=Mesoflavibacter zeaxanthinifaciens subsp. sabulilitoris TaxID=1520893 RepID=A0A2T1NNP5_9FLAO|nr:hypothetical protein [Mesoflavibacter zeaxanthinifaciens]MBB3125277.1 hypothetical protein [Mesoflavibacter zeaxanthinifaciens subsp. sabulilitoris]PSG94513.1 hypothetical protein C7H61_00840 [Mesoflavibacter zeaxanthinifaciens subsp. sabulilitoris]